MTTGARCITCRGRRSYLPSSSSLRGDTQPFVMVEEIDSNRRRRPPIFAACPCVPRSHRSSSSAGESRVASPKALRSAPSRPPTLTAQSGKQFKDYGVTDREQQKRLAAHRVG